MTTDTETRPSFLGVPIDGEIVRGRKGADQRPLSDLEPIIRELLADEYIHSFGWDQYTPYFNDGEPCIFRVHEPWFMTVDDAASDDEREDYEYELWDHPTLGKREYEWVNDLHGNRIKTPKAYEGEHEASYDRCAAFKDAIGFEAFDHVLLGAFGDHAQVTVKRDGISVRFYEHD